MLFTDFITYEMQTMDEAKILTGHLITACYFEILQYYNCSIPAD